MDSHSLLQKRSSEYKFLVSLCSIDGAVRNTPIHDESQAVSENDFLKARKYRKTDCERLIFSLSLSHFFFILVNAQTKIFFKRKISNEKCRVGSIYGMMTQS